MVDETSPELSGAIFYVIVAGVLIDVDKVRSRIDTELFTDKPNRSKPFHWSSEGPEAKTRLIDIIIESGAVAHCRCETVGRKDQVAARKRLIPKLANDINHDGVEHLIIESGGRDSNQRDLETLQDHFGTDKPTFHYDWRTKAEPVLWVADAICGAIYDDLTNTDPSWMSLLRQHNVVTELRFG